MSALWGGYYSLIIPYGDKGVETAWKRQLRAFDPDHLAVVDPAEELPDSVVRDLRQACAPFRCGRERETLSLAEAFGIAEVRLEVVATGLGLNWLSELDLSALSPPLRTMFFREFGVTRPYLFAEGTTGGVAPDEARGVTRWPTVETAQISADLDGLKRLATIAESQQKYLEESGQKWPPQPDAEVLIPTTGPGDATLATRLPFSVGRLGITEYLSFENQPAGFALEPPFMVVIGDTVRDYCLAHNQSRLGWKVEWFPASNPPSDGDNNFGALALRYVGAMATRRIRRDRESAFIASATLSKEVLENWREWLARVGSEAIRVFGAEVEGSEARRHQEESRAAAHERILELSESVDIAEMRLPFFVPAYRGTLTSDRSQFLSRKAISPLSPSRPPGLRKWPHRTAWISSVEIAGYSLPRRWELSKPAGFASKLGIHGIPTETRISWTGVTFVANTVAYNREEGAHEVELEPVLDLLEPLELFNAILSPHQLTIAPSAKGGYFEMVVRRTGGLEELGKLLSMGPVEELLHVFAETTAIAASPLRSITIGESRYLTTASVFDFLVAKGVKETDALINRLQGDKWLDLGFVLKCGVCRAADWYEAPDVGNEFTCRRCDQTQVASPSRDPLAIAGGPGTCYRLNELAKQFIRSGSLVTGKALAFLQREAREDLIYVPESEIFELGESSPVMELDFVASWRNQLTLGECRKSWKLTGSDREDMKAKVPRIEKLLLELRPDAFVLASDEQFSETEILSTFRKLTKRYDVQLFLLTLAPSAEGLALVAQ